LYFSLDAYAKVSLSKHTIMSLTS